MQCKDFIGSAGISPARKIYFQFETLKLVWHAMEYGGFLNFGYPKMDGLILLKWMMIWGYPHFRKPPYLDIAKPLNIATLTNQNWDFI